MIAALVMLAVVPYLPFFALPHIADDYIQIELGRNYGPPSAWGQLAVDPLYRCRATSILLTYWTESWFGVSSALFQAQSVALHVLNTLLVAALGWWRLIGWRLSIVAAGFFAVYEGHQEAVVWYAALPELLVFLFALLTLHAWLWWLRSDRRSWTAYGATAGAFLLALLSKESAVALVPLLVGVAWWWDGRLKSAVAGVAPFAVLSGVYAGLIFAAHHSHQHLNDGTFSFGAPVGIVMARSTFRLLWIWGLLALAWMVYRRMADVRLLAPPFVWIAATLLPYAFLAYMPHVPSRHVYWASMGLAFLVAAAMLSMPRRAAVVLAVAIFVHNCGWLWWKKLPQYERRAAVTEELVGFAKSVPGPVTVKCFPYAPEVAALAVHIRTGRPKSATVWHPQAPNGDGVYCDASRP